MTKSIQRRKKTWAYLFFLSSTSHKDLPDLPACCYDINYTRGGPPRDLGGLVTRPMD